MSYWREDNIRNNHGDEYAWSLSFSIDEHDNLVVTVDEKMPQPYEASDIYIGAYNSCLDFTWCENNGAAGYENYLIANLVTELGYLITPNDANVLTINGKVTIAPLGHEWDDDIDELIDNYLNR